MQQISCGAISVRTRVRITAQTDVGHSGFGKNGGEDIAVEGVWYAGIA